MIAPATATWLRACCAVPARTLDPRVLQWLHAERLFKLFVPDDMNGRMTALPDALRIFMECARIDGNLGWLVTIGSGGGYFVDLLPDSIARPLYTPDAAVLAGSGAAGRATRHAQGIQVNGRWSNCSGALHATFFTVGIQLDGRLQACVLQQEQITIEQDWDAFGLQATDSHSLLCHDALVDADCVFDLTQPSAGRPEPIYRFPFLSLAQLSFAAVVLGMAQAVLDEVARLQEQNRGGSHARWQFVQNLLQGEQGGLATLRSSLETLAESAWRQHLQQGLAATAVTEIDVRVQQLSAAVAGLSQRLLPNMGMPAVLQHQPLNYHWRNLVTANQHVLLKPFHSQRP